MSLRCGLVRAVTFIASLAAVMATVAVAGAQASEYGRCAKVRHHAGAYANAACSEASAGGTGGAYAWSPWGTGSRGQAARKGTYHAYTNGVYFKTSEGKIECLGERNPYGDSFDGEILSPTTGTATVVLQECAGDGSQEEAGIFWKHSCSNGFTRNEKEFTLEFPVVWRLRSGIGPEIEYEIQQPVTVECYPYVWEIRFSGTFGGPVLELGEMSRMSETVLSSQDLEVEVKRGKGAAWEAPVPLEIRTGGESHGEPDEFDIVTKYREKLEIKG